jgi:hypothetical protein
MTKARGEDAPAADGDRVDDVSVRFDAVDLVAREDEPCFGVTRCVVLRLQKVISYQ